MLKWTWAGGVGLPRLLVENGADPNAKSNDGKAPLHESILWHTRRLQSQK